jgi:hypothetical protein
MHTKSPLLVWCLLSLVLMSPWEASQGQVYSENFSSAVFEDKANGYLGGYYGSQVTFGQWFGSSVEASISGGELIVQSTSGLRGAFLVLAPSVFGSDTQFTLTVDVNSLDLGASGNSSAVRVFTGTGYDLSLASADALFINAQTGNVTSLGTASVAMAAQSSLVAGSGQTIDFTRPDGHAVMIFLGVNGGAWPFPEMKVGEVQIDVIPEPTTALLAALGSLALLRRRRSA